MARSFRQPIRLLHLLDGLLTQASLAKRSTGVQQRRQRQRLALTQQLLDPLPVEFGLTNRLEYVFWQALRWGTGGFLVALLLHR